MITDFLKDPERLYASEFVGVQGTPHSIRGDMTRYWASKFTYGKPSKEHMGYFDYSRIGEVKPAIYNDLWRLRLQSKDDFVVKINFEYMRPCFMHWLPLLDKSKNRGKDVVDKAYERMGGDAWALAEDVAVNANDTVEAV